MPTGTIRDNQQVKQLQDEIISMQKQLGWTKARLAEVIHCDLFEENDNEAPSVKSFTDSLKKQLKRPTTPSELLRRYIRIISEHPDYRKADRVVANPIRVGVVDISILRGVTAASKHLLRDMEFDTEDV
ncbi:hypothetical protein ORJ04_20530 [Rheinheimera baltica]|uniref:Uncharacterized protein n=1 Tax=Rheinheimera baltica TaxID=67576 RepID=A0ABT9I4L0_9GAMM|nr:hypothetical protein [Rheinheimera baltica]MDP5138339.1 hypothetical protein [Rheinheimera baltica]